MDTKLKTSKKIRLFIYRILFVSSFFTMLATAWMGREAFFVLKTEGKGILTGDLYYLPEFREYISKLYTYGLVGYIGAGDDKGDALSIRDSSFATGEAKEVFLEEVPHTEEDIIYHLQRDIFVSLTGNVDYPLYSKNDGHLILPEDVRLCAYWDGPNNKLHFFEEDVYLSNITPDRYFTYRYQPKKENMQRTNYVIALKNTDSFTSPFLQELTRLSKNYRLIIFTFVISTGLFLIMCLPRLFTFRATKRTLQEFSSFTGSLYLELKLLLLVLVCCFVHFRHLWCFTASQSIRFLIIPELWLYGLIGTFLYLLLRDICHNGLKTLKTSLTYISFLHIREYIKGTNWYKQAAQLYFGTFTAGILVLICGILMLFFSLHNADNQSAKATCLSLSILLILFGLLVLYLSVRLKNFVTDTFTIADKLTEIRNGTVGNDITLSPNSLLHHMVVDITDVEKGIEKTIEENLRANRMRVELITNVSHDLKTPLTSIINYSDLLCEENLSPSAMEYANALRTKAYRLKGMVQDVFEISKATSGNLPIEKTKLDLTKLIHQTLADMDERIQESTLTFKTNICSSPLMIETDGEKLYRIFQNLIVNALQYSLENSRVYIEVANQEEKACVWIKSISRQELDFDPKEIVERFVRADASRTSEGSGLGLSIVQSFTEACGGTFSIDLNADLFTAFVAFPLSLEPPEEEKDVEDT